MSEESDVHKFRKALESKEEVFWLKGGENMALKLFKLASTQIPAYKDFLKKNRINPEKINTIADFKEVPTVDKKNYLLRYPIDKLCWDGEIHKADMISLSSGSSGEPFFWMRGREQEEETRLSHELFLIDSFGIDKHTTLFIVSFAMGMWVAGTLTHRAVQIIAEKYKMTVITPGINKNDVLNIVNKIGSQYDQIIIAGYPPFVKDIIDEGETKGLNWKKFNVKFLFAAETFSEKWRDYVYDKVGADNIFKDSLNIYGTADALILGHETPLSIFVRRTADTNPKIYKDIFVHEERVPTLVQYNPVLRFFENIGGKLVFSAFSGIPLLRYDIGDNGSLIGLGRMREIFSKHSINLNNQARSNDLSVWNLPFLYVFGRSDFTASLYGINIYPENIRDALANDIIEKYVSGKFTMLTKNDNNFDRYLEINVELKNAKINTTKDLEFKVKEAIVSILRNKNNEYNELYKSLGIKAEPKINLCSYGHDEFFKEGVKQKWHKI